MDGVGSPFVSVQKGRKNDLLGVEKRKTDRFLKCFFFFGGGVAFCVFLGAKSEENRCCVENRPI